MNTLDELSTRIRRENIKNFAEYIAHPDTPVGLRLTTIFELEGLLMVEKEYAKKGKLVKASECEAEEEKEAMVSKVEEILAMFIARRNAPCDRGATWESIASLERNKERDEEFSHLFRHFMRRSLKLPTL